MQDHALRAVLAAVCLAACGVGGASAETLGTPAIIAQATAAPSATPAPAPTRTPFPITYGGYIRSYYFTRLNNPQLTTRNPLNQASWNTAFDVHASYAFGNNFSVVGSYLYADPFNGSCETPATHLTLACVKPNTGAPIQGTNPDDTLPGFILNTLFESYIQYHSPSLLIKAGNQVVNTPWALPSDTRLKPVAFLGGDVNYNFTKSWLGEVAYMNKFEARASSAFLNSTLLTATNIADAPGAGANLHLPPFSSINTDGFLMGHLGYAQGPLAGNAYYYQFFDIVNAFWADGHYTWKGYGKPFIALQGGTETNQGRSVIGKIDSQVIGIQGGYSLWNNVDFTVGYDYIPQKRNTIVLPPGVTCSTTGTIGGTAPFLYFLPTAGTPQCHNNLNGTTDIFFGGWASPYTDSYATDVLYTTSITQGMIDRRSAGQSVKVQATVYLDNKRVRFIASRAYYDYGNTTGGVAPTQETDLDGTYFFNPIGKGPYHGLSFRYRYAERTQNFFTTNPDFKYNRAQLEYDF
jgi:hypothetical protein